MDRRRSRRGQRQENSIAGSLGGCRNATASPSTAVRSRARTKTYLLLYKPKGYLTTYKDPEGRKTVYDLLPDVSEWIFPVGRLDQDTSGLLIMTNDTAFRRLHHESGIEGAENISGEELDAAGDDQLDRLRERRRARPMARRARPW